MHCINLPNNTLSIIFQKRGFFENNSINAVNEVDLCNWKHTFFNNNTFTTHFGINSLIKSNLPRNNKTTLNTFFTMGVIIIEIRTLDLSYFEYKYFRNLQCGFT